MGRGQKHLHGVTEESILVHHTQKQVFAYKASFVWSSFYVTVPKTYHLSRCTDHLTLSLYSAAVQILRLLLPDFCTAFVDPCSHGIPPTPKPPKLFCATTASALNIICHSWHTNRLYKCLYNTPFSVATPFVYPVVYPFVYLLYTFCIPLAKCFVYPRVFPPAIVPSASSAIALNILCHSWHTNR
jgi:hypothetical protein